MLLRVGGGGGKGEVQLNPNQKRLNPSSRRVWGWVRSVDIWPLVMDSRRMRMYAGAISIGVYSICFMGKKREVPFTAMLRITAGSTRDRMRSFVDGVDILTWMRATK